MPIDPGARDRMRKQLERIGLEAVVEAITDKLSVKSIPYNDPEWRGYEAHGFEPPSTPHNRTQAMEFALQAREFGRMLRLAVDDKYVVDRDYHLSRAVEIGQQVGYMPHPRPCERGLYCRGWKLLIGGYESSQ